MTIADRARRLRRLLGARAYPVRWADLLIARAAGLARGARGHERAHVLVAPPRAANIGDQAMVESFAALLDGPLVVIDREDAGTLPVIPAAGPVRLVRLPALLYGLGPRHLADVWRFGRLVAAARSVSVFGADTMDGAYAARSSVMRSRCVEIAARAGRPARVLGFSWNATPRRAALRALRAADAAGVRLMSRDPVSAARLRAHGLRHVEDVADLVFADERLDPGPADQLLAGLGARPVALVNASGMIGSWFDQVPDYWKIVQHLVDAGMSVVLVPHAHRVSGDDVAMGTAVAELFPDERVVAITELWSPAAVRALAARASVVVSGRMHLSVIGLSEGVPVVVMSTQGKVAGLLRLFDLEDNTIEPHEGMGGAVNDVVKRVLVDRDEVARAIRARLPLIRALARRNAADL
ncbi:polysaccharide pyruvyl transferase family protein [Promicromonospora sp. NPDC060204]|uniref:polysaccharide pyruvyl transferase family protein n=1 Tax=Promicromonospora sp. NPDC060204 TaxID=3347071 RepID=UPI003655AEF1